MSTRRERAKEPAVRLNKQLAEIIGGVFENMEHPIYLYLIGFSVFFILIWLGNVYFNKGIREL